MYNAAQMTVFGSNGSQGPLNLDDVSRSASIRMFYISPYYAATAKSLDQARSTTRWRAGPGTSAVGQLRTVSRSPAVQPNWQRSYRC